MEYKGDIYHLPCGDLCASTCLGDGAPPEYEAEGCFEDDQGARILSHKAETCPEGQEAMSPDVSVGVALVGLTLFRSALNHVKNFDHFMGQTARKYSIPVRRSVGHILQA